MLRQRLFCTISIFLCALFSASAQDWESLAVAYERTIFDGAGLEETNNALRAKAHCYKQLGRWADASATLARIRMFALDERARTEVLYEQELCFFLGGEFSQAAALVGEVGDGTREALLLHALVLAYDGRYDESEIYAARFISWDGPSPRLQELLNLYAAHPLSHNATAAMVWSFFPPLGHFYNGEFGEGVLSGTLNAAALAFTVANFVSGYWVTGLLGGGIVLNYTFMGNQERNAALVEKHKRNDAVAFGDRVREFLLSE